MITQIYHKKNELFEVEFYKDKECTQYIEKITGEDIYIELQNGDISPLMVLESGIASVCTIYTPFISKNIHIYSNNGNTFETLDDITPNLSKYIPEDNAILFLSGEKLSLVDYDDYYNMFSGYRDIEFEGKIIEGMPYHPQIYGIHTIGDRVSVHKHEHDIDDYTNFTLNILKGKKLTIFLHHGTQSELEKANEVAKELKEKYGVEEVNLFALDCFYDYGIKLYQLADFCNKLEKAITQRKVNEPIKMYYFNKIITTNSIGILKTEDSTKHLQVIDAKEIFEEYVKENNL